MTVEIALRFLVGLALAGAFVLPGMELGFGWKDPQGVRNYGICHKIQPWLSRAELVAKLGEPIFPDRPTSDGKKRVLTFAYHPIAADHITVLEDVATGKIERINCGNESVNLHY